MERKYYNLIDRCMLASQLSLAIARNADSKESIRMATEPLIADCHKRAAELIRTLTEVLDRQELADVLNMP